RRPNNSATPQPSAGRPTSAHGCSTSTSMASRSRSFARAAEANRSHGLASPWRSGRCSSFFAKRSRIEERGRAQRDRPLEGLSDPELRSIFPVALLQIRSFCEIPVQLEAEEVEREAISDGGGAVDQTTSLEKRVGLSVELRATDVRSENAAARSVTAP